jgi:TPR repeat protein
MEYEDLNRPNSVNTDANLYHVEGNRLFAAGRYLEAIKSYSSGIKINPLCPALFTNRATCYMKLQKPLDLVISDCDASIEIDKTWWRAFQRKAEALTEKGRYQEAESVVTAALRFNPGQDHFRKQLDQVRSKWHLSKNLQAPFGSSSSNFEEVCTSMYDNMRQKMKTPKRLSSAQEKRLTELEKITENSRKACGLEMSGHTEEAIVLYEKSAHAGCTLSMAALGRIFHNGEGLSKPDFERGIFWLRKCVGHGPSELALMICDGHDPSYSCAQGSLGQAFRHGIGLEKDTAMAESLLRSSAEAGDIVSMNNLGSLLSSQEYSRLDEGAQWYQRAAESGYSLAMVNIASCMMRGTGTRQDVPGARAWLLKAEAAGEPHASTLLAELAMEGGGSLAGVVAKLETALAAERRCNQVQVHSLQNLAACLLQAQEHADDALSHAQVEASLRELGIAAAGPAASHPASFESFAELSRTHPERLRQLKQARPAPATEARAVALLREAVESGSADAALHLGQFHLSRGREADALAVYLELHRAQNHGEASFMAGSILTRRGGPLENAAKGLKLLVRASEQGHAQASELVRSLQQGGEYGARLAGAIAGGPGNAARRASDADPGGASLGRAASGRGRRPAGARPAGGVSSPRRTRSWRSWSGPGSWGRGSPACTRTT